MNSKLYDALENSLSALEEGQELDAVLARYPDLAGELRPMLEISLQARTMSGVPVPAEAQRRGRSRLLQRAAEMREAKGSKRRVIPMFPRAAIALGLAGALVLSSTGLVRASSGALPGDQLYPVKRTWEGVRLLFVFSAAGRDVLESEYEQERVDEIDELLAKGRSAAISFSGLVTKQQDGQWLVSGIPVHVGAATRLPAQAVANGAPVMVIGSTREDGAVEAQEIQLLQPGVSLPPLEPSDEKGNDNGEQEDSKPAPPKIVVTPGVPAPASEPQEKEQERQTYQFSGVVQAMQDGTWIINGQPVSVGQAEINGRVQVGAAVSFEGYYDADGNFIVTKIEVKSGGNGGDSSGDNNKDNKNDASGGKDDSGDSGGSGDGGSDDGH